MSDLFSNLNINENIMEREQEENYKQTGTFLKDNNDIGMPEMNNTSINFTTPYFNKDSKF